MPGGSRFGLVNTAVLNPPTPATAMSTVGSWDLTDTKTGDSYVASNTLQGTQRGGGIRIWNGSISGRGNQPPLMPNDERQFTGYTEPANGQEGSDGITYVGPIICQQIVQNWNWQANQMFDWGITYNGNPGLIIAEGPIVLDESIPPVESACINRIMYASTNIKPATEIPKAVSASLTISAALATEANSSTTFNNECYQKSTPGNIDWTLSINQEDYQRGVDGAPAIGSIIRLDLFVNGSEFWDLRFGRVEDYSNLVVDRSTGATMARTINIAMSAFNGNDAGLIALPGQAPTSPWWGKAEAAPP